MNVVSDQRLVYVVDDDEALCDSLRWLIESAGYRVAAYSSAEAFLEAYRPGVAACLVLDVRMPGSSGLELQQELRRRAASLPIIFMTGHGDVAMAVDALKQGAFHFLEKPFRDEQLLAIIAEAADRAPTEGEGEHLAAARLATLTTREREVLDLVVSGRKNKQIADALGISVKTVEVHRSRAMEKMGATSVAQLVQAALSGKSAGG